MTTASSVRQFLGVVRAALPPRRIRQVSTTVGDQALVSAGTFLMNVLLARFAPPTDYGVFVLAFSGILLSLELGNAVLLEPMMVFGSHKDEAVRRNYFGDVLVLHIAFTGGLMVLVWLACGLWRATAGPSGALATVTFVPVGLLGVHAREFTRKVLFTALEPEKALWNDTLYLLLLLGGLALGVFSGGLTAALAFGLLGTAGVISAAVGLVRAGVQLGPVSSPGVAEAVTAHWGYGRWMIGVAGARWSANELYYFVAAIFLTPASSGTLKAVQNVYAPVSLFLAGLGNLLLPVTARLALDPTRHRLRQFVFWIGVVLGSVVLTYAGLVILGADAVFEILYGGNYREYAYLLPVFGAGHLLVAAFQGPSLGLRALNRPRAIFLITTVSAAASVLAVVPLTATLDLVGAAGATLLSLLISSPLWVIMYRRAARDHSPGRSTNSPSA